MHKDQGNLGEAAAMFHFTRIGAKVSKPLFENTPYDLVVDLEGKLSRVQVKSTSYQNRSGNYILELRTKGGNSSWNGVVKTVDSSGCDLLFAYCTDGSIYVIPPVALCGQGRVTLGKKYEEFRVL